MIGTKLAHYEITSHIGSGGMGDVYQATDTKLAEASPSSFCLRRLVTTPIAWCDSSVKLISWLLAYNRAQKLRRIPRLENETVY
jgi:hypothetical protein